MTFAKKSLGQNFLMHAHIAERIADVAKLSKDSIVFEIGPGTGMLTRPLLERAGKVIAVEVDQELFGKLQIDFADEIISGKLELTHGDIRAFDNYGAANLKLGGKYNLGQRLFAGWETGVGLDYEFPTGQPPAELTDGLRHLRSYITFSHRLESHPDLRIFVGLRGDKIAHTSVPGTFGKNSFQESSTGITGGWVIDHANWHYTFEASCDTTRLIGNSEEDIFTIRPGVLWEIPTRRNRQIMSHWMVGVALNHTYGPGGNSLGASFKLRYSRDLKYRRDRAPVDPTP